MPPPQPLTRTPPPRLDFTRPGTPLATDFDDIYFSVDGGLDETREVFLSACGLPEGWMDREQFVIGELGFGSGLNFLATCQAFASSHAPGHLHFISIEGFPFERDDLVKALSPFDDLRQWSEPLISQWPGPVKGLHRLHFGRVTLTLIHDQIGPALAGQDFKADAWFLDGFSPAKNPDMWSDAVLAEVARLSTEAARLGTFTVAGSVRRGLERAGFDVEKRPGFGRKRHRLEARRSGIFRTSATRPPVPTIIGHGIAGASIARAFIRRGLQPRVLFDPDHPAASGNGVALIKPRLDLQDQPMARFFLSSYLYALQAYDGAIRHTGITHIPSSEQDAARFARLISQEPLGPGHLEWHDDQMTFARAAVIDTEQAREDALRGATLDARAVMSIDDIDGPVIIAAGYGIRTLLPDLSVRFSRGQLSWAEGSLTGPVTYGGYAVPVRGPVLLGATHDRIFEPERAFELRDSDDQHNLDLAKARGLSVGPDVTPHRASVRVNTADTVPRLFRLNPFEKTRQVWGLTGLGSRGFVYAPLLGEALVSQFLGEPSPLDRAVLSRLSRDP